MTEQPQPTAHAGRPTVAFVLAAGLGTRMRPLTNDRPKPMVALAGRPLIDHVLDRLAAAGVGTAVVNVHYRAEVLMAHLAARAGLPRITISDERGALLDTGGGVIKALPLLGPGPFLIHNSDTVWLEAGCAAGGQRGGLPVGPGGSALVRDAGDGQSNLDRLLAAWDPASMDGLLMLAKREHSIGYDGAGDFELAADGRLTRRRKGTETPYVFAGVSVAHPRLLDGTPAGPFSLNQPWDLAIAAGRLHGLVMRGLWMHVGTPETLVEAEQRIASHGRT